MGRKALLGRLLLSEVQTAALLRRGVLVGRLSWASLDRGGSWARSSILVKFLQNSKMIRVSEAPTMVDLVETGSW